MKELMFFDANAVIGDTLMGPKPGAAELLRQMDRYGVEKALVRHGNLATTGAINANREMTGWISGAPPERLYGVWCILPDQCEEIPSGKELFQAMRKNRIAALTLMPDEHRYLANRLTIGRIMDEAAERKIPILLHAMQNKWQAMYNFMQEFPKVTAIISAGHKWGSDRNLRPLLENYENLHAELAGYWVPEGIYDLAQKYGADRLLYGSGFPTYAHGSSMLQIKHSALKADEVAKIAGLNMAKLLEESEI